MAGDNDDISQEIQELLGQERLCVFIGAGLSASVVSTWRPFVSEVIEHVGLQLRENYEWDSEKLKKLIDLCEDIDVDGLCSGLKTALAKSKQLLRMAMVHIGRMRPPLLVTTNFDPALWEVMQNGGYRQIHSYPRIKPIDMQDKSVCYLHGKFEFDNPGASVSELVLGQRSFLKAYALNGPVSLYLKQLLSSKSVLFLGFNPLESNFLEIFKTVQGESRGNSRVTSGETSRTHYVVLPYPSNGELKRRLAESEYGRSLANLKNAEREKVREFLHTQPEYQLVTKARGAGFRVLTYPIDDANGHAAFDELLSAWASNAVSESTPSEYAQQPRVEGEGVR